MSDPVRYRVDRHNRVIYCNPAFDQFATENGAPTLTGTAVHGRLLLDYCASSEVRQLFQALLERVRQRRVRAVIPFRCDGPTMRRYMELSLQPLPAGEVEFVATMCREELRASVPLLESQPRSGGIAVICSWCKRLRTPAGWTEVEAGIQELGLFNQAVAPELSHGICPPCAEVFDQALCPSR
jgi:hypothetical protein